MAISRRSVRSSKDRSTRATREPARRVIRLVNALLEGKELDRRTATEIMGTKPAQAAAALRQLRELRGVQEGTGPRGMTLRLPARRQAQPSTEVAVAACLGASLAPLFDQTKFERGLREAFEYVKEAAPNPALLADFDRKFYFVRKGGEIALPRNAAIFERLVDAVVRSRRVVLRYLHFDGRRERVRVEPLSIAVHNHQLYVVGRSNGRVHPYRFARIEEVGAAGAEFVYPPTAEYDPEREFRDSFGVFLSGEEPDRIVVLLDGYWKTYALHHRWHPSQHIEKVDRGVHVELHVRPCHETVAWILSFGERAEVLEPARLRNEIGRRARALAKRYAKTARGGPKTQRRRARRT